MDSFIGVWARSYLQEYRLLSSDHTNKYNQLWHHKMKKNSQWVRKLMRPCGSMKGWLTGLLLCRDHASSQKYSVQRHSSEVMPGNSVLLHLFFPTLYGVSWILDGVIWMFGWINAFTPMSWDLPPGTTFWWSGWEPLLLSPLAPHSSVTCGSWCSSPWATEVFYLGRFEVRDTLWLWK